MGNVDELNLFRHLLNHIRVATHVGVVQRRVHFVQHTERSGIELENREHKRDGCQRLLTPPDNRWMVLFFLPGGLAMMATPVSSKSSPPVNSR